MDEKSRFFEQLRTLTTGDRAALRRSCGKTLRDADGQAVTVFYRCLPYGIPAWQEARWFAVSCFACLWDNGGQMRIENAFLAMKTESDTVEKRIAALMDMQWDDEGFFLLKLTRLVKMANQKGYILDCESLLEDLLGWNSESKYIQRKWIKALYLPKSELKEGE